MFHSVPVRLPWQVPWAGWESRSLLEEMLPLSVLSSVQQTCGTGSLLVFLARITVETSCAHARFCLLSMFLCFYLCPHCYAQSICLLRPKFSVPFPPDMSWDRISCIPGCPQNDIVAEDGLELLTLLPLPPECWHFKCALLCPASSFSSQNYCS